MSLFTRKSDAISEAEKGEADRPSIVETKAIAEEGLIYGLPLVMYYTSAYELFVDPTSSQYKAPIGTSHQRSAGIYLQGYGGHHAKQRHAVLPDGVDLRAEPTVISVPAVPKPRYYSVQLTDANTFNYGYMGSRTTGTEAGDYMIVGPDWKGETPPQIKHVFHSTTPFSAIIFRTQLFDASDMPNVVKIQAGYKVQPLSSFLKQPAPPAAPAVDYLKADAEIAKKEFWEVLDFALRYISGQPGGGRNPREAGQHWHRCGQEV